MTKASLSAFKNPNNRIRRKSQKATILEFLRINIHKSFTYPKVGMFTGIRHSNCQARLSELHSEGKIKITGEVGGFSKYQFGESKKLLTVREAYRKAVSESCPILYEIIENRVNGLIK